MFGMSFRRMSAALEAVDADGVAADLLRLQRVPDGGAFMDYLMPAASAYRFRAAACGLDFDAAFLIAAMYSG
jgi:hypothetical protein